VSAALRRGFHSRARDAALRPPSSGARPAPLQITLPVRYTSRQHAFKARNTGQRASCCESPVRLLHVHRPERPRLASVSHHAASLLHQLAAEVLAQAAEDDERGQRWGRSASRGQRKLLDRLAVEERAAERLVAVKLRRREARQDLPERHKTRQKAS
jgi:hypothetical protein